MRAVGQALDQAVEQRLGLRVDPVEILEDQQQRLPLALAQQELPDRVEGRAAALRRVAGGPGSLPELPGSTGTSSSASRAGSAGSSAGSSARTPPVTFSRMAAWSSRLSIWK